MTAAMCSAIRGCARFATIINNTTSSMLMFVDYVVVSSELWYRVTFVFMVNRYILFTKSALLSLFSALLGNFCCGIFKSLSASVVV